MCPKRLNAMIEYAHINSMACKMLECDGTKAADVGTCTRNDRLDSVPTI